LENTGYFDENQRYAEDVNFWMRISLKNKMYILNENLVVLDGGKRSFGVSGLSANLKEMEKGFQKNLKDMKLHGRINGFECFFYSIFYKLKYFLLIFRTFFSK
jgi:hypothetical protein